MQVFCSKEQSWRIVKIKQSWHIVKIKQSWHIVKIKQELLGISFDAFYFKCFDSCSEVYEPFKLLNILLVFDNFL